VCVLPPTPPAEAFALIPLAAVLSQLAETLSVAPATLRQIEASFALVSRDCLA
jgi:hypothetical protein